MSVDENRPKPVDFLFILDKMIIISNSQPGQPIFYQLIENNRFEKVEHSLFFKFYCFLIIVEFL